MITLSKRLFRRYSLAQYYRFSTLQKHNEQHHTKVQTSKYGQNQSSRPIQSNSTTQKPLHHSTNTHQNLPTQSSSNFNNKITIPITPDSPLLSIIKKRKTAKQKILQTKFFRQWLYCFVFSFVIVIGGHMFLPQTLLSKNFFFQNQYEITRKAQKQVLSGKFGTPKIPPRNS